MARRNESALRSVALGALLLLTVLYGCRAFDPDPVIVNRPPDTFIVGAPAETTGSRFQRHMYWYGTDRDGDVVRYIYAITDSTVRDTSEPDVDEEDDRFNPATDITTLETIPGRYVGWTSRSDSIFVFEIDRGATPSKDITFHIVAIDDRGAIDPSPARLHFFNNSLGNPALRFSVYIDEGPGGAAEPQWVLRWVGGPAGFERFLSPENSSRPFIGFARRFKIAWEASSPNGQIIGYRFKAEQGPGIPFTPPDIAGEKQWDPELLEFVYQNDTDPESLPGCDTETGVGCPPEQVRWPSRDYLLSVVALDGALVESEARDGELAFEVNYPPESSIVRNATYPRFRAVDLSGEVVEDRAFGEGDTVPAQAYVLFQRTGFDRVPSWAGAEFDSFCCDRVLDPLTPTVRYQSQALFIGDQGNRTLNYQTNFSPPEEGDTIGLVVGPFDYRFLARTVDEHARRDPVPDTLAFFSGYLPRITSVQPGQGDSLIFAPPFAAQDWPENQYPYTISPGLSLFWDGLQYLTSPGDGRTEVQGNYYRFRPRLEGRADPREPLSAVRAWSYAINSEHDPLNLIDDGPGESPDLSFYNASPEDNLWEFAADQAIQVFVPSLIWSAPQLFDPTSESVVFRQTGEFLRRHLAQIDFRVKGRTTKPGDKFLNYLESLRPNPEAQRQEIDIERLGRRSPTTEKEFFIFLGVDPQVSGEIQRFWPDF